MPADRHPIFATTRGSRAAPLLRALGERGANFLSHELVKFPNGNQWVSCGASLARECAVIWSPSDSIGDSLVELGLLADALRRSGCRGITCVLPYLDYSRSDRTEGPGTGIGSRVFIRLLESCEIDRFALFTLHAPPVVGFFDRPVLEIEAVAALTAELTGRRFDVVVAPDGGRYREARNVAQRLGCDLELLLKVRKDHSSTSALALNGSPNRFRETRVLVFDDEILTGDTMRNSIRFIASGRAAAIEIATIYPLCSPRLIASLLEEPLVSGATVTNLGSWAPEPGDCRVKVVDLTTPLLAALGGAPA